MRMYLFLVCYIGIRRKLYSFRWDTLLKVSRSLSGAKELPLYLVEVYIIATLFHFLGDGVLPSIPFIHLDIYYT